MRVDVNGGYEEKCGTYRGILCALCGRGARTRGRGASRIAGRSPRT